MRLSSRKRGSVKNNRELVSIILTETRYKYEMNILSSLHIVDVLLSARCYCQATEDSLSAMCVRADDISDYAAISNLKQYNSVNFV